MTYSRTEQNVICPKETLKFTGKGVIFVMKPASVGDSTPWGHWEDLSKDFKLSGRTQHSSFKNLVVSVKV